MKIKKVVIDGFRAYENAENGTFDFSLESGECADFVAIFAPNGFGKTSFYDAVEYALTDNISRFVRDAYRSDYDSKSKTQVQRKTRQYILRNHSIDESTTAKVVVTLRKNGVDEIKPKPIPRPKSGNRDFHFKKRSDNFGSSGLSDVFLSQEAIDAFLREEKADARYTRFMASFGDSGETYRANIATLKRELESTLDETREQVEKVRAVAERPINEQIFTEINQTISSLVKDNEIIEIVGKDFNAEQELALRNKVTKRSHELSQLHENYEKSSIGLTQLLSEHPQFATALKRKAEAQNTATEITTNRNAFKQREVYITEANTFRAALSASNQHKSSLLLVSSNVSAFETARLLKQEALANKLKLTKELQDLQIELTAIQQRELECQRRIDLADSKTQELLDVQKGSISVYLQIDVRETAIRGSETELIQYKKAAEALGVTLHHARQQFELVRTLKINEENLGAPEFNLISSEDFSPIELRGAYIELGAKQSVLTQATKTLDLVKSHASMVGELIDIGQTIVSHTESSDCPLCSHPHKSYQVLLNAILSNDKLSSQEASALEEKQSAESALIEAKARIEHLFNAARQAAAVRLESLRASIQADEESLAKQSNKIRDIESQLTQAHKELENLRKSVFSLLPAQFAQRIATEIDQLRLSRNSEVKDRTNCKLHIDTLQAHQKDLLQAVQTEQSKADAVEINESYRVVTEYCNDQRVETSAANLSLMRSVDETNRKISNLEEKLSNAITNLSNLDLKMPFLATWDDNDAMSKERLAQEELLNAEAIIVPFVTTAKLYAPEIDLSESQSDTAKIIEDALAALDRKKELSEQIKANYALLNLQLADVRPYVDSLEAQEKLAAFEVELRQKEALEAALDSEYQHATRQLNEKIQTFFYPELINAIYRRIDPHPDFKKVEFACNFDDDKPTLEVFVADEAGDLISPNLYFSAAQINILSLSIFLARALHAKNGTEDVGCIFIDDPIHSMDSINILSTIDLLRSLSLKFNRQIILSTHDRNFFELLQRKLPAQQCKSKFLEIETFGKVVPVHAMSADNKTLTI